MMANTTKKITMVINMNLLCTCNVSKAIGVTGSGKFQAYSACAESDASMADSAKLIFVKPRIKLTPKLN